VDARELLAEVLIYLRALVWFGLAALFVRDELVSRRAGDPARAFQTVQSALVEEFRAKAQAQNRPRGVEWVLAPLAGTPVFVTDAGTGGLVALVPLEVRFEPRPGSELEDVLQAREPRTVTAMFTFERGEWRTTGRAVFNLAPDAVIARSGGRFGQPTSQTTIAPDSPAAATRSPSGETAIE
jgi:hypothetical protein